MASSKPHRLVVSDHYQDCFCPERVIEMRDSYATIVETFKQQVGSLIPVPLAFPHKMLTDIDRSLWVDPFQLESHDQHPRSISVMKAFETMYSRAPFGVAKVSEFEIYDIVRQVLVHAYASIPLHSEALIWYTSFFKSIKRLLSFTSQMLRIIGLRQSVVTTHVSSFSKFGEALFYQENKSLPKNFFTTFFVSSAFSQNILVNNHDYFVVSNSAVQKVTVISNRLVDSIVPKMQACETSYRVEDLQPEHSNVSFDSASHLDVNNIVGYAVGRYCSQFRQTLRQDFLHGWMSWRFVQLPNVHSPGCFVMHPDNDYWYHLVDFLSQFDQAPHVAFAIKIFGLADAINIVAGKFFVHLENSISHAVWFVLSGQFYKHVFFQYYVCSGYELSVYTSPCARLYKSPVRNWLLCSDPKPLGAELMRQFEGLWSYPKQIVCYLLMKSMVNSSTVFLDKDLDKARNDEKLIDAIYWFVKALSLMPIDFVQRALRDYQIILQPVGRFHKDGDLTVEYHVIIPGSWSEREEYLVYKNILMCRDPTQHEEYFSSRSIKSFEKGVATWARSYLSTIRVVSPSRAVVQILGNSITSNNHEVASEENGSHGEDTETNGHKEKSIDEVRSLDDLSPEPIDDLYLLTTINSRLLIDEFDPSNLLLVLEGIIVQLSSIRMPIDHVDFDVLLWGTQTKCGTLKEFFEDLPGAFAEMQLDRGSLLFSVLQDNGIEVSLTQLSLLIALSIYFDDENFGFDEHWFIGYQSMRKIFDDSDIIFDDVFSHLFQVQIANGSANLEFSDRLMVQFDRITSISDAD